MCYTFPCKNETASIDVLYPGSLASQIPSSYATNTESDNHTVHEEFLYNTILNAFGPTAIAEVYVRRIWIKTKEEKLRLLLDFLLRQ